MTREVRYCATEDNVRIAYCVEGTGPVLLHATLPNTNIQFESEVAEARAAAEFLAGRFTYVRYDPRGFGMSDRDSPIFR